MGEKAVVTLQLGHYSNFVGAHFWNLQEANFVFFDPTNQQQNDINHDILFREGETLNREQTFTPRLISVDKKGALGHLPEYGDLYEPAATKTKLNDIRSYWTGDTTIRKEEPRRKNDFQLELALTENPEFEDKDVNEADVTSNDEESKRKLVYDLDDQVELWSDFLKPRFHLRTNSILKEYQHKNALKPFDIFGLGVSTWKEEEAGEDIEDRIRFFVEEADSFQGFQILFDNYDAFGGMMTSLCDLLHDEYTSKTCLSIPVTPCWYDEYSPQLNSARFLNSVLSIGSIIENTDNISPLSLASDTFQLPNQHRKIPGCHYKPELNYHSSAVLASALDTITMPWRCKTNPMGMQEIVSGLTPRGRKLNNVATEIPFDLGEKDYLVNTLHEKDFRDWTSLTPGVKSDLINQDITVQAVCLRGLKISNFRPIDFKSNKKFATNPFWRCDTAKEALQFHFSTKFQSGACGVFVSETPCPVGKPFPRVFETAILNNKGFKSNDKKKVGEEIQSVPVMTSWQNSKGSADHIKSLSERAKRINLHKCHRFGEAGLEEEEFKEILENLETFYGCYQDHSIL